jgi:uncharacterized membrane protein
MTKPPDFASFKALWEKHQIKLLQDGATKCFLLGLFTYCFLGSLTLLYYSDDALVSPYFFISLTAPVILILSWYVAKKIKNPYVLAYGNSMG